MRAKTDHQKSEENSSDSSQNKGPKPLTKWQKYGYIFFGVTMGGLLVTNAILFCEFDSRVPLLLCA